MDFKIIIKSAVGANNLSRSIVIVYDRLVLSREVAALFMMKKHYPKFMKKNNKNEHMNSLCRCKINID